MSRVSEVVTWMLCHVMGHKWEWYVEYSTTLPPPEALMCARCGMKKP